MKTFLIILAVIVIFVLHHYYMKQIDKDEAKALKTPGTASFLRSNFGGFISKILEDTNNYIVFERTDQIRFGKMENKGYELICGNMMDFGGPVMYVVIKNGTSVLYEKKFKKGTDTLLIASEVLPWFK